MLHFWESIGASDVFAGLRRTAIRDVTSYLAELLGRGQLNSLLDTAALRRTLEKKLDWDQLRDNLDGGKGWAHGAGIVATSSSSGRTIVFLQGKGIAHPPPDDFRGIDYVPVTLAAPHVLASAAIPIAFLPVHVDQASRELTGGSSMEASAECTHQACARLGGRPGHRRSHHAGP